MQRAIRGALLRWFRNHRRQLPWREAPSLYKTVVAEFMLQQTQVKTALPYFARWMQRFPDFTALAAASPDAVLQAWAGLGFYSRARRLHRLAAILGSLPAPPRTAVEWRKMPGVGPYTAAAIASLAFGDATACVDGNVVRVLARLVAERTRFASGAAAVKHFAPLAATLLNRGHPGAHNEALMELGATVCLPRAPRCSACPLRGHCAGRAAGRPELLPRLARRRTERRIVWRVWRERNGMLLLHRENPTARRLAGLLQLPSAESLGLDQHTLRFAPRLLTRRRSIAHQIYEERIVRVSRVAPEPGNAGLWIPLTALDQAALSGPHRRWIGEILSANVREDRNRTECGRK